METNIGLHRSWVGADPKTGIYRGKEDQHEMAQSFLAEVKEKRKAIADDPDMSIKEKKAALEKLDFAEKHIRSALDFTTMSTKYDVNSKSKYENNDKVIWECLEKAEYGLKQFAEIAPHIGATPVPPPPQIQVMEHKPTVNMHYAGPPAQDNSVDSATGGGKNAGKTGEAQVDQLMKMMSSDPDKFMATMKNIDPEDRQSMMMLMNDRLQNMNQMFSMMSNLSKAMHDTAKALISNMRV